MEVGGLDDFLSDFIHVVELRKLREELEKHCEVDFVFVEVPLNCFEKLSVVSHHLKLMMKEFSLVFILGFQVLKVFWSFVTFPLENSFVKILDKNPYSQPAKTQRNPEPMQISTKDIVHLLLGLVMS